MKPGTVLKVYLAVCFAAGIAMSAWMVTLVRVGEIDGHGAAVLALSWNVFFLLILPLLLDWSECTYFNARFMQLEELAESNPDLKAMLEEHCKTLSIDGLRLAAVDAANADLFSYGFLRQSPRLMVPASWLTGNGDKLSFPSIEHELHRMAKANLSGAFVVFAMLDVIVEQVLLTMM